ncbi:MAG: TetR/AcrR family transcriptional regulator C-terminal domain-containing protein, partial [Myxococcales bacterium]|nr:TetR/AcrR family transcriptional regulator C-terminal domain-containing protein [Myxococcales bacterium]
SHDGIVDAVLSMLERRSDEPLTIARIAKEVDAVPAALYRHFGSLDDLLDGVLTRVLETNDAPLDDRAPWQEQLATWMRGLRSHLLQYPAVLALIDRSERTSPAWLEASSALVAILARAGLADRDLAASYLWILEMTVGLAMQEAMMPIPKQIAKARASQRKLGAEAQALFAPLAPAFARLDGDALFGFVVEQVAAAVASKAPRSRARRG